MGWCSGVNREGVVKGGTMQGGYLLYKYGGRRAGA